MQNIPLKQIEKHFKSVLLYAPGLLGNDAVNFFLDRFAQSNWIGNSVQFWQKRSTKAKRNKGRALLIDTGRLRRSIRIVRITGMAVTIGTDVPYAKAHNEGFKGVVKVKAHARNRYTREKTGTGKFTKRGKERMKTVSRISGNTSVSGYERRVNIPRRQFMGNSPFLEGKLKRRLQAELLKGLRNYM